MLAEFNKLYTTGEFQLGYPRLEGSAGEQSPKAPASARVRLLRASADHRFNARLYFDSIADHGGPI
jgi:hypothetical protein